jgi:hypothetical protein
MVGGRRALYKLLVVVGAIAVAVAWVLVDHPYEGPVILTLTENHGVHRGDVLVVIPLVWAWIRVVRS